MKNIALKTLKLIVTDQKQSKLIKPCNQATQKKRTPNNIISITPYLRRNAGYNFGGFVA